MDESTKNAGKYKAGFTNEATKKDFVKHTPLRIVPGLTDQQLSAQGMRRESHPTPINPGTDGSGK